MKTRSGGIRFRREPRPSDVAALRTLIASVGVFHPEEQAVAVELLEERLRRGRLSGYYFWFAERSGELAGYCAYGPIPLTRSSYDLYWIVVGPDHQGHGLGRSLLRRAEVAAAARGGEALYVETSSRSEYERTRAFYRKAGYRQVARLADFYAPGDDKVVLRRQLGRNNA